jgi:hypothetical protein
VTAATAHPGLLETIETQRFGCELAGSPLYCDLLVAVKADVLAGGVSADLLAPHADAPFGDAVVLRFLAGLHGAVLAGDAPDLARHYPSVGGTPGPTLGPDAIAAIDANRDRIAAQLRRCVQTNETGRSAALIGGLIEIGRLELPLRLLEIGSSSGLNLLADQYRYEAGDASFGPLDSPLRFADPWFPGPPDLSIPLVIDSRRGCDPAPIDPSTDEGRTLLRSFVWPDQLDRLARLDAALSVAALDPPVVDEAGAGDWLAAQLAEPVVGRTTVVVHSIMLQYLSPAERAAVLAEIEQAGERATDDAPLAWLRLEPGGDQADLRVTTWPGGESHLLARSSYHGPPVVWLAAPGGVLRPTPR